MMSPTGAVQQIVSNVNDLTLGSVDSLRALMTRLGVMQTIDWTTMLLIFWVLFALIVYSVGNILVVVINKRKQLNDTVISDRDNTCVNETIAKTSVGLDNKTIDSKKSNVANGPDRDCVQWVNHIIQWFSTQNDTVIGSMFDIWLNSLNTQSKKLSKDYGFSMQFLELCREKSFAPELSNVMVDKQSNDNISVNCKLSTQGIKILVKAFRDNDSVDEESIQYELCMNRFEGMMKIVCISEEQLFVVRFVERPDFKASLKQIKGLHNQNQKSEQKISEDAIINAIINTITKTVVDLCLSGYQDFPPFKRSDQLNNIGLNKSSPQKSIERKLFVKVVKANGLTVNNKGIHSPYCVIEVDEPSQQAHTSTIKNTSSPVWNEHFIFNLKEESTEILFELYDKSNDKFLGLGIVSVEELKRNPSQNQVLKLQSRPLETGQQISGSLSVEFLFIEHSSDSSDCNSSNSTPLTGSPKNTGIEYIEQNILKPNGSVMKNNEVPIIVSSDADEECSELETIPHTVLDVIEEQINQNDTEFGLNDNNANKSNLTIHSNHRASDNGGGSEGYGTGRGTPDEPSINEGSFVSSNNSTVEHKNSRSRTKEPRSIIKAIRKRFSFNKNRSKSMEIRTNKECEGTGSRDSSVSSATSSRARSMPGSREPSAPKDVLHNLAAREERHKTNSYSNISDISGYSTRTFIHEKSTLIVEANESGSLKHYVLPISLANKSKWRRRGLKLHLYNDHLFVAKHLSGSITCQVCDKLFSRRPGKQGYQCRDCDYMCHKRCHIQVDNRCTKSTISSLKLDYITDPKAKPLETLNNISLVVNDKPYVES